MMGQPGRKQRPLELALIPDCAKLKLRAMRITSIGL
jgi:hypothetical protein